MTLLTCDGTILKTDIGSGFEDGSVLVIDVCLELGLNGLAVEVNGGLYPEELFWAITYPSGFVDTGGAGLVRKGGCISPFPSAQPTVTPMPTVPCELYTIEIYDEFGDG